MDFNAIPSNLRVPFVAVEINPNRSAQGSGDIAYRALIIGQKLVSGTAADNSLSKVTSPEQVAGFAGRGSMLHREAKAWFAANKFTEVWIGALPDATGGVAAAGSIAFTGPATADGTIFLYAGGERIPVAVSKDDTANDIATAIAAALPTASDYPVTAAVDGTTPSKVDITFRHKGECGNGFDIRLNYNDGEALPAGVGATIIALTGGTTNPTLTTLISAMGDTQFHVITNPYTDATSLTALENELADRFGPMRMIDGVMISAKDDTVSSLGTFGKTRNSKHSSIPGIYKCPTPAFEIAAHVAAVVAYYAPIDPARPFQTLPLPWIKPPAEADLFTLQERNLLLYDGIATLKVEGGQVQIDRLITTYQTDSTGAADESYLDLTTPLTLLYLRYDWRRRVALKYPRHKVANDGTQFGAGQPVVTPKTMKAEAISWFRDNEERGLVEDFDQFKRDVVVQRNASNPSRMDVLLPPNLINGLVDTATGINFIT